MKFDLFHPDILNQPYRAYTQSHLYEQGLLRGSAPMPEFPECWYVIGYNEALQVLRNPIFVHDRSRITGLAPLAQFSGEALQFWEKLTEWPLFLDAPEHTEKRQLLGSFFKEALILDLAKVIQQKSDTLLDQALTKPSFDFMHEFAYPLSLQVICHLIGIQPPDLRWFKSHSQAIANTLDLREGQHDYQESLNAVKELNEFFCEQMEDPLPNSLLSSLMSKGLNKQELLPLLLQIIFAGQETSADAIGLSLLTLSKHRNVWQLLSDNPQLIDSAVREGLRYDSSIQFSGIRVATETVAINGTEIARGESVLIALGACNHDPRYFKSPEVFDIKRNNSGPELSFGHGIHHCLGIHLARLELQIALQALVRKLPASWRIESFEMRPNRLFRGPRSLIVSV